LRERDTWRDTGALYLSSAKASEAQDHTRRPAVVEQVDYLIHEGSQEGLDVHSTYRFLATGMRTDMKAKMFEWRSDRLELPGHILEPRVGAPVGAALARAELVARALGDALLRLHAAAAREKPPWADIRSVMRDVIGTAQAEFWRRIEPSFRAALFDPRLGGEAELQVSWLSDWVRLARDNASRVLDSTLDAQGDSAADLRRAEAARRAFFYALKKGEPRDE